MHTGASLRADSDHEIPHSALSGHSQFPVPRGILLLDVALESHCQSQGNIKVKVTAHASEDCVRGRRLTRREGRGRGRTGGRERENRSDRRGRDKEETASCVASPCQLQTSTCKERRKGSRSLPSPCHMHTAHSCGGLSLTGNVSPPERESMQGSMATGSAVSLPHAPGHSFDARNTLDACDSQCPGSWARCVCQAGPRGHSGHLGLSRGWGGKRTISGFSRAARALLSGLERALSGTGPLMVGRGGLRPWCELPRSPRRPSQT